MKARVSDRMVQDPNEFAQMVLSSPAFAGARLFVLQDPTGEEQELLLFALKSPVTLMQLRDMVHVLVDSVAFYECWKGGQPPSETDLASLSPEV